MAFLHIFDLAFDQEKGKEGFPGCLVVKNPPAKAGNTGLIPVLGRSYVPRNN